MGVDRAIAATAASQHGVITLDQLCSLDLGRDAVKWRLRTGSLIRVHETVYRVGHCAPDPRADAHAAVLACGDDAALFGRAAAALWTVRKLRPGERMQVAGPRRLRQPDIDTFIRDLPDHHVMVFDGIRVTTPARTVFDLATLVSGKEFERAANQAQVLKLATKPTLLTLLDEVRGRPGAPALAKALQVDGATRSGGEDALWRLLLTSGLPRPKRNHDVHGWECDFVWPELRLVVEVDSHQFHGTAAQFEQDLFKTEQLEALGWRVVRIPARQISRERQRVLARVARAIGERSTRRAA